VGVNSQAEALYICTLQVTMRYRGAWILAALALLADCASVDPPGELKDHTLHYYSPREKRGVPHNLPLGKLRSFPPTSLASLKVRLVNQACFAPLCFA